MSLFCRYVHLRDGDVRKWKRYLCATGGVLGSTAGYELCVVVLEKVFVETHVLFLGEDGVVGLEAVLGEHCFIAGQLRSVPAGLYGRRVGAYPWPWMSEAALLICDFIDGMSGTYQAMDSLARAERILGRMP